MKSDHSEAPITWMGETPNGEILARVREDIRTELDDLSRPGALIYHCIQLTPDPEGPTVVLRGNEADEGFDAEYLQEFEPITFDLDDFPNLKEAIENAEED